MQSNTQRTLVRLVVRIHNTEIASVKRFLTFCSWIIVIKQNFGRAIPPPSTSRRQLSNNSEIFEGQKYGHVSSNFFKYLNSILLYLGGGYQLLMILPLKNNRIELRY